MASFQEALNYSKQNPNSDFATKLRQGIESGQFTDVAKKEGIDIAPMVKKTTQPVIDTQTENNPTDTSEQEYKPTFQSNISDNPLQAGFKSLGNVPKSLLNFGGSLVHAVAHPIDTIKGILNAGEGGLEELTGSQASPEARATFDQLKQIIHERYGSIDNAKKTATEDPIGFGADVMSLLSGGASLAGKGAELESMISKFGGPGANLIEKGAQATGLPQRVAGVVDKAKEGINNRIGGFKPLAPGANSFDPAMKAQFESEGIKAPVSAMTKSPFLQSLEAVAGKTMFGQKVTDIANDAKTALENKTNELVEKVNPDKTMSDAGIGSMLQKGAEDFHNNLNSTTTDTIYPKENISHEDLGKSAQADFQTSQKSFDEEQNKIFEQFKKDHNGTTIVPGNTRNLLAEVLRKQGLDSYAGINPRLKNLFEDLSGETPEIKQMRNEGYPDEIIDKARMNKTVDFEKLQAIKESIGQDMIKFDDPDLKRLYGAISQDLAEGVNAADPEAGARLQEMNAEYSKGTKALESNLNASVTKSSPENIPNNILSKNGADTIKAFKDRVTSETFQKYANKFIQNIFDGVKNDKGVIDVEKLKESIAKYDPATIKAWMGKEYPNLEKVVSGLEGSSEKSTIASSIRGEAPEKVAQNIIKHNNADYIKNVKEIVGKDKFKEVSKAFLRQQFEKAVTRKEFDIHKFAKNLNSYDKETLAEIFPKDQLSALNETMAKFQKYKNMQEALKASQKMAQGSQTAFLRNSITAKDRITGAVMAAMTGHPGAAAIVMADFGGELLLSKLFTTNIGRKLLTEGLTGPNISKLKALKLSDAQINTIKKALVPVRYTNQANENEE